jgi:hypothetical protein
LLPRRCRCAFGWSTENAGIQHDPALRSSHRNRHLSFAADRIGQKERGDEPAKEDVRAWSLDLLIDPKSQFEILPGLTDEGKLLTGLRVRGSVTPAMDFYFDPETFLLHRLDWRGDFYRFSEWKEQDGLKYASRTVILKKKDGKPWFFHEITELERLDQLPQGLVKP